MTDVDKLAEQIRALETTEQLNDRLQALDIRMEEIACLMGQAQYGFGTPQQRAYAVVPIAPGTPIEEDALTDLITRIREAGFEESRLLVLQEAVAQGAIFTCEQFIRLGHEALRFPEERIRSFEIILYSLADPVNRGNLVDELIPDENLQKEARIELRLEPVH